MLGLMSYATMLGLPLAPKRIGAGSHCTPCRSIERLLRGLVTDRTQPKGKGQPHERTRPRDP